MKKRKRRDIAKNGMPQWPQVKDMETMMMLLMALIHK